MWPFKKQKTKVSLDDTIVYSVLEDRCMPYREWIRRTEKVKMAEKKWVETEIGDVPHRETSHAS